MSGTNNFGDFSGLCLKISSQTPVRTGQSHRPGVNGEKQKKIEGPTFIRGNTKKIGVTGNTSPVFILWREHKRDTRK